MVTLYVYAAPCEGERFAARADLRSLQTGVGKAAAAASLAASLAPALAGEAEPAIDLVVLFGVCGAHRQSDLKPGDICLVAANQFADEGVEHESGFSSLVDLGLADKLTYATDPDLTERLGRRLELIPVLASSVSTCSGTDDRAEVMLQRSGSSLETMEGAAVAMVCDQMQVAMIELRCVSNFTGNRAAGEWQLDLATERVQSTVLELIEEGFFS